MNNVSIRIAYLILAACMQAVAFAQTNTIQLRNGANSTTIIAPTGGNYTLTLPAGAGTNGQALTTNGSGTLSWSSIATSIDGLSDAKSAGTNFTGSLMLGQEPASLGVNANYNTAVGIGALSDLATGDNNVAVGYNALNSGADATECVAIGYNALAAGADGYAGRVVAIGPNAGASCLSCAYSVFIGRNAGTATDASADNTVVGNDAFRFNTSGADNTVIGANALENQSTGNANTALGRFAGVNKTTGSANVFLGYGAGPATALAVSNSLYINNSASNTPLIKGDFGATTLTFNGSVTTTGTSALNGNVTVGGGASASELRMLEASGDGSNYTAFKAQAQAANVTYTLPAADGTSGYLLKTNGSGTLAWTNSLVAGTTLTAESASGGGQLNIADPGGNITWVIDQEQAGPGLQDRFRIWYYDGTVNETRGIQIEEGGDVGIGIANPAYKLDVVGDINASANVRAAGTALTSDARLKRNIQPLTNALDVVQQLRPVSYEKRADLQSNDYSMKQMGFIAQELESVLPNSVQTDKSADAIKSVDYISIIPVLTKALQEQQQTINKQQAEIDELRQLIKRMSVR
jgi:hypothetical protein